MKKSSFSHQSCVILSIITLMSFSLLRLCVATTYSNFDLSTTTLDPATTGFMITGNGVYDQLGLLVSTAGDINNDGYDDIIVRAQEKNNFHGGAYVIYGGAQTSMSNIDLTSIALDTGFIIKGEGNYDQLGSALSTAGDINNDGYDDIIIGAKGNNWQTGAAYLIYGGPKSSMSNIDFSTTTTLDPATAGFMIKGGANSDGLGYSVSKAGDINNDGYDDIMIGTAGNSPAPAVVYVIYGGAKSSMSNIDLSTTTLDPATTGFMITGADYSDSFGQSMSTAGDINNDGYDDIIIGAEGQNSQHGAAYVIYGGPKSSMSNIDFSTTTTLDPATTGFVIKGEVDYNFLGYSVDTAGDINKDGYDDIIIGAYGRNSYVGGAYVIYGGPKSSMSNIDLSSTTLDPATTGFIITGSAPGDELGYSVSTGGDINKDGYDDILVGAFGGLARGTIYVIYGGPKSSMSNINLSWKTLNPATTGLLIAGNAYGDHFGCSVSTAGDINKDGYDDIIVGAWGKNFEDGAVYVIYPACPSCTGNCPANCHQCSGLSSSCLVCNEGYTLSSSICVPTWTSLKTEARSVQLVSSISQGVGSIMSMGSSIFSSAKIVSKIVQNTRYMNLSVTTELEDIYQTWGTDLISWQVPNAFSRQGGFKESPYLFSKYDLDSPFLTNFWSTLMTIGVGSAVFIAFSGLQIVLKRINYSKGWAYSLLKKLLLGSFNFTLVQIYGCFDDTLFYLALDAKTNPFNTFFAWMSIICAMTFLAIGCFLVFLNFWKVKKYQKIKSKKNMEDLNAFNEKNQHWELFYGDFNDDNFWNQSFLAIIVIRSGLSSLIIAVLYGVPVLQTTLLLILDGAVLLFLVSRKPFNTLQGKLAQYYFEAITLLVHLCTLILSLNKSSEGLKSFFSTAIIYLNTALVTGSIAFMFIDIFETIKEKIESNKALKDERIALKKTPEETSETQNPPSSARLMTNLVHCFGTGAEAQIKLNTSNNEKTELFEKWPALSRLNHSSNLSISGGNMGPVQPLDLISNAENSVMSDMNTSNLIGGQRDQGSLSMSVRRKPLWIKRQQAQKRNSSMMKNHATIYPESFENT